MVYDEHKAAFITCVNDERVYAEACLYLQHLVLPEGMTAELLPVYDAVSMAGGYQAAMQQSDARYKVYLHQDVFLTKRDFLIECLKLFQSDSSIGLIGLAGCPQLPASGIWWSSARQYGSVYHAYEPESMIRMDYGKVPAPFGDVEAVDGVLMMTCKDIPWRDELFTGWHFYDVSQSVEFRRRGLKVIVPAQDEPWCVHACGEKDLDAAYWQYQKIFLKEYGEHG